MINLYDSPNTNWNRTLCECRSVSQILAARQKRAAILAQEAEDARLAAIQQAGGVDSQIFDQDGNLIGSGFFGSTN